jgi:hypothetical protein
MKAGYSLRDLDDLDCNFDRPLSATLEIINWHLGYSKRCLCKEALCPLPVLCGVVLFSTSPTHLSRKVVDDSDWLPRLVVLLHGYQLRAGFSFLAKNALHLSFLLVRWSGSYTSGSYSWTVTIIVSSLLATTA